MTKITHSDFLKYDLQGDYDVIIADPPYLLGKDFGNDSDSMPLADFLTWSKQWIDKCLDHLSPNGLLYIYNFPEVLAHLAVMYPINQQRWLVWHYTNKNVHSSKFWQRSHESILCLWKDRQPALNIDAIREEYTPEHQAAADSGRVRKGTKGRYSTKGQDTVFMDHGGALPRDVIKIPALAGGAGAKERWFACDTCGIVAGKPENKKEHKNCPDMWQHPTQKPYALTEKLIKSVCDVRRILIPFAGSGSECLVAEQLGLEWDATEINEKFVKFGNAMLQSAVGEKETVAVVNLFEED